MMPVNSLLSLYASAASCSRDIILDIRDLQLLSILCRVLQRGGVEHKMLADNVCLGRGQSINV